MLPLTLIPNAEYWDFKLKSLGDHPVIQHRIQITVAIGFAIQTLTVEF